MEETQSKISFAKNLNKFNFNSTLSVPIDSNANIKTILDVNTYLFDLKVECGSGKALINGKIGIKVLYLDMDNITNSISDSQNFSETYSDSSITTNTYLNVYNSSIVNNILSTDGTLKVNCDISMTPVAYLNLAMSGSVQPNDMLITKKSELKTNTISQFVNTNFEHTTNLETKHSINKILCHNAYFCAQKVTPQNGYAVVEGKVVSCLLYETSENDDVVIKEIKETENIKHDVEISNISADDTLDLTFVVDKSNQEISTEIEDNNSVVSVKNTIKVCGAVLKSVSIDVVDDLYSTENEIESTKVQREYTKKAENFYVSETISNETSLTNEEPAIDDIIANLNMTPEITNTYIKDNHIFVEGIVTSNLTYIDENKEIKHKQVEIPFVINSKVQAETLGCVHNDVSVIDNRVKIKRGTIIEMEYTLFINLSVYQKDSHEMIDNYTIGKQLDFSKYDFQIYLAKPGESIWDLCKRIKISPNDIHKYNKDLPLVMIGGEKVVIKR